MRRLLITLAAFLLLATPAHASWSWPVRGDVITPYRNGDNPYAAGQHRGIDIAAAVGTPVVAAAGGEVRFAGTAGSSGVTVSVRTGDGFDTSYLHLSALAVRAGASVSAGERVGAVGTTGTRSATQPHLHFGVREAGSPHAYIDPLSMLPPLTAPPPAEAPRPAPVPVPLAPSPAPQPAQRGAPRPEPAPRSVPRPAPAPRSAPAPRGAPRPLPGPRPAPAPRSAPRPAPRLTPAPSPRLAPAPRFAPSRRTAPRTGPARAPAPLGAPRHSPASLDARPGQLGSTRSAPAPSPLDASRLATAQGRPAPPERSEAAPGPDIGWALACAGLLLAAGILGLTDGGRRASVRTGSGVPGLRGLLAAHPLHGRR